MKLQFTYAYMHYRTFPTHRHIQHAVVQAFLRQAESLVFWVVFATGQHGPGRREAIRRDSLHLHLFLKAHVDGPVEESSYHV